MVANVNFLASVACMNNTRGWQLIVIRVTKTLYSSPELPFCSAKLVS